MLRLTYPKSFVGYSIVVFYLQIKELLQQTIYPRLQGLGTETNNSLNGKQNFADIPSLSTFGIYELLNEKTCLQGFQRENLSPGFQTRSDTNPDVHTATGDGLKFQI